MMVEDMLTEIGCIVAGSVPDVPRALAVVGREPVDAVILDIHVVGGDSFGFADEMLRRGTPVVFCTGDNCSQIPHPYDRQACITKPFGMSDLVGQLTRASESRVHH